MSEDDIEKDFPALAPNRYQITSEATIDYNCIAWAALDQNAWWWPDSNGIGYWPPTVPREETIEAFIIAYETLGYFVCKDSSLEQGYEKIAIFVKHGKPTHASRQLESGKWTSKLGQIEDIEHNLLEAIEGDVYGHATIFMKRPRN